MQKGFPLEKTIGNQKINSKRSAIISNMEAWEQVDIFEESRYYSSMCIAGTKIIWSQLSLRENSIILSLVHKRGGVVCIFPIFFERGRKM